MSNVKNIENCYGCGVCALICPKKIIEIRLNKEGFFTPQIINIENCINCSLCIDVCAFSHDNIAYASDQQKAIFYAGWSNNYDIRRKSSSGGVSFEIARFLINSGYKVYGVKYDVEKKMAEHYKSENLNDLVGTIGSEYIQSYTLAGLKLINIKEKNLVIGTPCQIDSYRRYLQKYRVENNFILVDFFCHCVPSIFAWWKYLEYIEKKIGKISSISWRNKFNGWHDSWAICAESDGEECMKKYQYKSSLSEGDIFYRLFLDDLCSGRACSQECKYKCCNSAADIRIGDLWGDEYKENEEGVSAIIAITEKGSSLLKKIDCTLVEHSSKVILEGQLKQNIEHSCLRPLVIRLLKLKYIPIYVWTLLLFLNRLLRKIKMSIHG